MNAVSFFWINSWSRLNVVLVEEAKKGDLLHCNQITFSYEFSASLSQHLNESHQWRSSTEKLEKTRVWAHTLSHAQPTHWDYIKRHFKVTFDIWRKHKFLCRISLQRIVCLSCSFVQSHINCTLSISHATILLNLVKAQWRGQSSVVGLMDSKAMFIWIDSQNPITEFFIFQ